MGNINRYQNFPALGIMGVTQVGVLNMTALKLQGFYLENSISASNFGLMLIQVFGPVASFTLSFGIYTLTGSTLTITNSGTFSTNVGNNESKWISFALSASQALSPQNYYFGLLASYLVTATSLSSNSTRLGFYGATQTRITNNMPGIFIRGKMTVSSSVLPLSVATSDLDTEATALASDQPQAYILMSA